MRRRIVVVLALVVVTVVLALSPASAHGGCQAFGVQGVSDQARMFPGSMGAYASFFGQQDAMDDVIHQSQEDFCSGS